MRRVRARHACGVSVLFFCFSIPWYAAHRIGHGGRPRSFHCKALLLLRRSFKARGRDDTEYDTEWWRDPDGFIEHWARRIAKAAVTADAKRCLERLPGLRTTAYNAYHGVLYWEYRPLN